MRAQRIKTGFHRVGDVMRNIEQILRALLAPAIIASVLVAFMTLTFLAAQLLTYLLGYRSLGIFFFTTWVITTLAGVILVRQLPRVLDDSARKQ